MRGEGDLQQGPPLPAAAARDAVQGAGVVITMLPTADAWDWVISGGGVAGALAGGYVRAPMGPIGVAGTLRSRGRLASRRPGVMSVGA